jgi:aspartate/methionine/tyrosine aminotransferase
MISTKISTQAEQIKAFHVMSVMSRAKALEASGREIVHMEVGEPDFATPQPVIEAGKAFIETGNVHYTEAKGLLLLREKLADFYKKKYAVTVSPERFFITPGASGALSVALASLLNTGDEVLIADPGYPCNANLISLYGGYAKSVDVFAADDYQLNADIVTRAWNENTKGVMFASPSNPTGTLIGSESMSELINAVAYKQGFLISDEIYHGLVYGERAVSALEFSDDVFVLNSFSKFFGMTGWRLGWLIVPEAVVETANKLMQNLFIAAPTHSQYAALAAFEESTQLILEQRCDEFEKRRDVLYKGLQSLGFKMLSKPSGAFYLYADCSEMTDDSYTFALDLLETSGVAVTPGIDFGKNQPERYIRFAYTTSLEQIHKGLSRIKGYLEKQKS